MGAPRSIRPTARLAVVVAFVGALTAAGCVPAPEPGTSVGVPARGRYYHGVYPGGQTGWEDDITPADLRAYERAAGRRAAWVYFSHNWFHGRRFPTRTATWIRDHGSVPFIRLMLRSPEDAVDGPDPVYSIRRILDGDFDRALVAWGRAAASFGTPLIVEWGTEMNGDWFHWNGRWNGGAANGPRRFRAAYRHIVEQIEAGGARNITWVFHVNGDSWPQARWNRFEEYYPGDDVVDWVGVSIYGSLTPIDGWEPEDFVDVLDRVSPRLHRMAPGKPQFVFELGSTRGSPYLTAPRFAERALRTMLSGRWPHLRGFSWWNETWQNDDDPAHDTDMRVQRVPGLSEVFKRRLHGNDDVVDRPLLR